MRKIITLLLLAVFLTGCDKDEVQVVEVPFNDIGCGNFDILSDFLWRLVLEDGREIIIEHTDGLRSMARTGNVNSLQKILCKWETGRTGYLKTGHKSDINNIGFATQLIVENRYIIAMYHPNNYPDHFIIYDLFTKEWTRWEENGRNPRIYLQGKGD